MRRGDLSKWEDIGACRNLLFFAQLINELLFDYSIPSNRVSTLNSHFLCLDALSVINAIESHGINEGALKPVVEELYTSLEKDITFSKRGENPLIYFMKTQPDGSLRPVSKPEDLSFQDSKNAVITIYNRFFHRSFRSSWYIDALKDDICTYVIGNRSENQLALFRQTKSFLTELINRGYSPNYITYRANHFFYNRKDPITSPEMIKEFLVLFPCKENKYEVVLIADRISQQFFRTINEIEMLSDYKMKGGSQREKKFFRIKDGEKYIVFHIEAMDPFSAAKSTIEQIVDNVSVYRLFDHKYQFSISRIRFGVYDESGEFYTINQEVSPVQRAKTPSKQAISQRTGEVSQAFYRLRKDKSFAESTALLNAIRAHDLSLDSRDDKNQLLDLWSIFETLLDISQKHSNDRIQQICVRLVPILKRKYLFSLFEQLTNDIKNYSEEQYRVIIQDETDHSRIVQKVCEFCLLDEYVQQRQAFLDSCSDFPLLQERIEYYNSELKTPFAVFCFNEKHSRGVRWQVMRIYRNRNMIIHNGKSSPYLSLLVENLHSYVDDFLDYVIQARRQGFNQTAMIHELYAKECEWQKNFQSRSASLSRELIGEMLSM